MADAVSTDNDARFAKIDDELRAFAGEAKAWFTHPDRSFLQRFHAFFRDFFTKERLAQAEWADFQKIGDHVHAMNQLALAKARAFGEMNFPIEQYRTTLAKLAFGEGSVEDRMRWFLTSSEAASKYLGVSAISEIMAQLNPDRYVMWNKRDKDAIRYLGLEVAHQRGLDDAAQFEQFNATAREIFPRYTKIVGRQTELPIGLEVDQFLSWIYATRLEATAPPEPPAEITRAWLYAPGSNADQMEMLHAAGDMGIGWEKLGDLSAYASNADVMAAIKRLWPKEGSGEPTNNARTCWDFARSMQPGDLVFAKKGRREIVAWGIVQGPYRFDDKTTFPHRRKVDWKAVGSWPIPEGRSLSLKTLTNISQDAEQIQVLTELVRQNPKDGIVAPQPRQPVVDPTIPVAAPAKPYGIEQIVADVFVPRETLEKVRDRLLRKLNLVLQGPPGVGKTYVARRLAWLLMGEQDDRRVGMVQFHQSLGYEDFVQGFRPRQDGQGFARQDGSFLDFCKRAAVDPGRRWVFIIDEINRGNISKILGELLMLIEHDKRDERYALRLALQREEEPRFSVPRNVYIIGLMNTADRSLAVVDHALRRRFAFLDLEPAFGSTELSKWLRLYWEDDVAEEIELRVAALNKVIASDPDLGPGYRVGHSHFCDVSPGGRQTREEYRQIIETDLAPLLKEYWFDRPKDAADQIALLLAGADE
jgi:5-methylcytosine-specific restriction protein B